MWRTIIISGSEKLKVSNKQLVICGEQEITIPIEDIYSVVIENRLLSVSIQTITELTGAGVHVLFCDERHLPVSLLLPLNTHYRVLSVLKKQILMNREFKDILWKSIIKAKITNQIRVLEFCGKYGSSIHNLEKYAEEIIEGDLHNREGVAAKVFFREMYGAEFIRMKDDAINAALNYGYAIIRASVSRTLVAYGFNCAIGIHHIGEYNPFNLADDIMEPIRPIVDLWVENNSDSLIEGLTKENRKGLIGLINRSVTCDNKKTKLRYAIDRYINSFVTCIDKGDVCALKPPILNDLGEETEDEQQIYAYSSLF